MGFLEWLQGTWFGVLVAESLWGYPIFETIHTIGMAMMIGSLGLINLRVLGYKPELPLLDVRQLLPLAWIGFTMNAISGTLLFTSDAVHFWDSYTFRVKSKTKDVGIYRPRHRWEFSGQVSIAPREP